MQKIKEAKGQRKVLGTQKDHKIIAATLHMENYGLWRLVGPHIHHSQLAT